MNNITITANYPSSARAHPAKPPALDGRGSAATTAATRSDAQDGCGSAPPHPRTLR